MPDNGYVPFISRVHWTWMLLLTAVTAGIFPFFLALYLSWWIRRREISSLSLYFYGAITIVLVLASVGALNHIHQPLINILSTGLTFAWIATGFLLRSELRSTYGNEFEINPFFTAIFSVLYLNYCLWAIGDGA